MVGMGKGEASPRRLFMRNSPSKNVQENVGGRGGSFSSIGSSIGNSSSKVLGDVMSSLSLTTTTTSITPQRKVLTPIPENNSSLRGGGGGGGGGSSPVVVACSGDSGVSGSWSSGEDMSIVGVKRKGLCQSLFFSESLVERSNESTPERSVASAFSTPGKSKHAVASGLSRKSPSLAQQQADVAGSVGYLTPHLQQRGGGGVTSAEVFAPAAASTRPAASQTSIVTTTPSRVSRSLKYGAATSGPVAASSAAAVSSSGSVGQNGNRPTPVSGVLARTFSSSLVLPQAPSQQQQQQQQQRSEQQQFELQEDPLFWNEHNVQVLIRTRPINNSEMATQGFSRCLKQESANTITWLGPPESRFTFDHVAGDCVTQEKLFKVAGLPMVENCMAGYNSCMFAYGQTGSGKTHTMLGDIDNLDKMPSEDRGMIPRVFEYLFARIRKEEELHKDENLMFMCRCSFLEIYNEQITDLLEPTSTNLHLREDVRKGVYVENLSEVEVHGMQDVIHLLNQGAANRRVAATNMNRESSRSHSVFTCIVKSKWERDSMTNIRFGHLNLVDLAGSERQKSSGAEGERLKEAANINKSLSTLGLVIMILVDVANGKQRHVPYRDSKLTFLLQDSLGGNSKTTIIATVSPANCNAFETLSTLKFAQRAKLIQNTAIVNEDASGDVTALHRQIQQMKEELDRVRRQNLLSIPSELPSDGSQDSSRTVGSPGVSRKQMRAMEALVAGALRREQEAYGTTQRLAAEIEQLNRLVQQREEESQCGKMILRFREDKIKRLESLSQGLLSIESYLIEEKRVLVEELQLLRARIDRNPELTRFAAENIRLLDHIRSLKEFQQGDRDVMAQEIVNLRDKLLDALEGKIAQEQGLIPLTTPQKKLLAPEIAANARENELLRIEADNYRSELDECRNNLTSCLQSQAVLERQIDELQGVVNEQKAEAASELGVKAHENELLRIEADRYHTELDECHRNLTSSLESQAALERQVDELQGVVDELKSEAHAKEMSVKNSTVQVAALEEEQTQNAQFIADLKLELQQSEERVKLQASRCESLELELKVALQESQDLCHQLQELSEHETTLLEECDLCIKVVEGGLSATALMLRRSSAELIEVVPACKLEQEEGAVVVGAAAPLAEKKLLLSVNELESLQVEHEKMVQRLKRREDRECFLKRKVKQLEWELMKDEEQRELHHIDEVEMEVVQQQVEISNDLERSALVDKLDRAKKELAMAQELNAKFQQEQAMMSVQQIEMDCSRSQAETETALAITSMQAQLMDMEHEMQVEKERLLAEANKRALQLASVASEREKELSLAREEWEKELSLAREEWYLEKERLIKMLTDTEVAYAEAQQALPVMKDCMKEVEIKADVLSMEVKELIIARQSWEEEKAHLERDISETEAKNERLAAEANEALLLASTVSTERGQSMEEWKVEKEVLMEALKEKKQEYDETVQTLTTMKDCMKEAEIQADAMCMELKELTRARQVWEEEKMHLERDVSEMELENEKSLALEVNETLQIASTVFEKELSILMEAWYSEKAALLKRSNALEQECVAVLSPLSTMTDRMKQAEILADALSMDMKEELGIARQVWEEEKACLERKVSELQVEIERLSCGADRALQVVASEVSEEERGFLFEREEGIQTTDALSVEWKELASIKQAWEEEKVCLERELTEMQAENERLSMEANEALQLTSWVSEKEQELAIVTEEWNMEKETLMKTLSVTEQKYVAARLALSIMTGRMEQAETRADALSMEMKERTTATTRTRQAWEEEEEERPSERDVVVVAEMMLDENERLAAKANDEALQAAISENVAHENELLRMEAEKYNSELVECRSKLVSCLQSHTTLERQLNELQDVVKDLKLEVFEKEKDLNMAAAAQDMVQAQNAQIVADLKLQLQQSEEMAQMEASKCESLNLELKLTRQDSHDLYQQLQELGHEAMLLTFAVCEEEQGVLILKEEWSFDKALLLKTVNEMKQEFVEVQQLLSMIKDRREEVEIQASELCTERHEFGRVRKAWEEEKVCLQRQLAGTSVSLEQTEEILRPLDESGFDFSPKSNGINKRFVDIGEEGLKSMTEEYEKLEVELQNRDNTILCAQMELIAAQSHYKEAEMEIEKMMQEKEKLVQELTVAQQEITVRQREVEALEKEMLKVMGIVAETQAQMVELEGNWRREREILLIERNEARFFANQQSLETASLSRNFETNQAALGEAEMMVDALVQAKLSAKSDAEGWKLENERLFLAQELATKNAESDTIAALAMAQDEVDMTIDLCLRAVGSLAKEIQSLQEEMVLSTVNKELKTEILTYKEDISKAQEKAQTTMAALHGKLQRMEMLLQEKVSEVVRLQTASDATEDELQCSEAARCAAEAEIKVVDERNHLKLQRMEMFLQENMSEVGRLQAALGAAEDELQCSQAARCTAEAEIKTLEERNHLQLQRIETLSQENTGEVGSLQAALGASEEMLLPENTREVVRLQAALGAAEDELQCLRAARCTAEAEIKEFEERNNLELQRTEMLLQENMSEVVRLQAALRAAEDELQCSQAARCTAEAEIKELGERNHLELQRTEMFLQENMSEVVRLQAVLGAAEDEPQCSQAARCTAEADIKELEERNNLELQRTEMLLQENMIEVVRLQAVLGAAEDELQFSQGARRTAEAEMKALEERYHLELERTEMPVQENMSEVVRLQAVVDAAEDELQFSQEARCTAEAEMKALEERNNLELQRTEMPSQENMSEVVRLQAVLGATDDELQFSQEARCIVEAEIKALEDRNHLELQRTELLLQENMSKVVRLQAALGAAEDELRFSQEARCTAEAEIKVLEERNHLTAEAEQEVTAAELEFAKGAVAQLLASVSEKDSSILELCSELEVLNEHQTVIESTHLEVVANLKEELHERVKELDLLRKNMVAAAACQEQEYTQMTEHSVNLQVKVAALESEIDAQVTTIRGLQAELEVGVQNQDHLLQEAANRLKDMEMQRDAIQKDLLRLEQELEVAKVHAKEQEAIAADVYQAAALLKTHANRGEEEVSSLGESLSQIINDLQEAQATKEDKERRLQELESELTQANNLLESLQTQCQEKDIQIENSKSRISDLVQAALGQATEYQQKLKSLEAMVEQVKADDRRASLGFPVTPKAGDKRSKSPFKGTGSPFKCMGMGMSQQMNSELDAELSAHQRRIEELAALATSRQKEIFLLNTRLAEAESMTHDIVRELLGVKLDISNYAVTQQQVQKLTADTLEVGLVATKDQKITTQSSDQDADEMTHIRSQLNEFIEERESWLEEINRRQAEMVAARVSVEKMRQRNQVLTAENENLKAENTEHEKRIGELEKDVKKLSGQQNIQQRIHHHARIKEENNTLRLQNEDLSAKLRRSDILFARVNDELARYRIADGKTPFLNIDEEQCLHSKLQEAEESNVQMAQKFVSLCTSILQVAGISQHGKEMDQSIASEALKQIENRLQSMEQELSDMKLKTRIAGEKRRLSELRAVHSSPMKPSNCISPQR